MSGTARSTILPTIGNFLGTNIDVKQLIHEAARQRFKICLVVIVPLPLVGLPSGHDLLDVGSWITMQEYDPSTNCLSFFDHRNGGVVNARTLDVLMNTRPSNDVLERLPGRVELPAADPAGLDNFDACGVTFFQALDTSYRAGVEPRFLVVGPVAMLISDTNAPIHLEDGVDVVFDAFDKNKGQVYVSGLRNIVKRKLLTDVYALELYTRPSDEILECIRQEAILGSPETEERQEAPAASLTPIAEPENPRKRRSEDSLFEDENPCKGSHFRQLDDDQPSDLPDQQFHLCAEVNDFEDQYMPDTASSDEDYHQENNAGAGYRRVDLLSPIYELHEHEEVEGENFSAFFEYQSCEPELKLTV